MIAFLLALVLIVLATAAVAALAGILDGCLGWALLLSWAVLGWLIAAWMILNGGAS